MNVAILSNDHLWTYNLRKELIEALLKEGHTVTLILPYGEKVEYFKEIGCHFVDFQFCRHGVNPLSELGIYRRYQKVLGQIKPDVVLTYATKPNIYGGMACRRLKIFYMPMITGVGNAMQRGIGKKLLTMLYRVGLKGAYHIFFQNSKNLELFRSAGICGENCSLTPGSGVNTTYHALQPYSEEDMVRFVFIGRLNADKGIREYLEAAGKTKAVYPNTEFHVVGMSDDEALTEMTKAFEQQGIVTYHGSLSDVRGIIGKCHCTVLPSYHEGMANVLLESASAGRALIATNISGCREILEDGTTGFLCRVKDTEDLHEKMCRFIELSTEQRQAMGLAGRRKMEQEFGRELVIRAYFEKIKSIENRGKTTNEKERIITKSEA